MKKFTIFLMILLIVLPSCSLYHLQTPKTVPENNYAGGIGLQGVISEDGDPYAAPGLWVRTGLNPNFDLGIHTWGYGVKLDGKYALSDYLAIGAGGGAAFMGAFVYNLEGSLYLGAPMGPLYPYGVARINHIGFAASVEDTLIELTGTGVSAVGGTKIKFGPSFSIYLEGGVWIPLEEGTEEESTPLFGIGFSVGH